jgi:hypothetical protein
MLAGDAKDGGTVALDLVRELDREASAVDQLGELGAALLDRTLAQIDAVEMEEVEGDELGFGCVLAGERRMELEEIRDAVLAEDHGFAVDHCRSAGKTPERLDDARHATRVVAARRVKTRARPSSTTAMAR